MNNKVVLIVGVAAIALIAALMLRDRTPEPVAIDQTESLAPQVESAHSGDTSGTVDTPRAPSVTPPSTMPAEAKSAPTANDSAPSAPIPVAASIARLVDAKNPLTIGLEIPGLHRQLEAEEKNLTQAPQLEYDIQSYLQSHSQDNTYTLELVECRTTMCELQVTASNRAARAGWAQLLTQMRREPWADAIASTVHAAQEDDATNTVGLVTILRLKPAQSQ